MDCGRETFEMRRRSTRSLRREMERRTQRHFQLGHKTFHAKRGGHTYPSVNCHEFDAADLGRDALQTRKWRTYRFHLQYISPTDKGLAERLCGIVLGLHLNLSVEGDLLLVGHVPGMASRSRHT